MKKLKTLLAAACLALVINAKAAVINLLWDYDALLLTPDVSFNVYCADSVPVGGGLPFPFGWTLLKNVKQSDQPAGWVPGQSLLYPATVTPGQKFYTVTALNFWGMESDPSNVVSTPAVVPPAVPATLRITLKTP